MKSIPILLMGCGGVGRQLLDDIINCRSLHSKQGLILRVLGVCDSRSLLVVNDVSKMEFNDASLAQICRAKYSGSSLSNLLDIGQCMLKDSEAKKKVIDIAELLGRSTGLVVVDCSASSETIETLKQVVDCGCCVVLANKKPLTCAIENHEKLMSEFRRIRFESTVGAGLPVIASVTRVLTSGDSIYRIIGSLSGTLGYVMSEAEDDPRDDLSGMDVARKGLILARLLGQRINMSDIKVESLYPEEFGPNSMSTEDFMSSGLSSLDREISKRVKEAYLKGNVLRYVCMIEGSRCQVGLQELQELPKDSPLGRLRGSDNVVEIYSRCYKDSPLVIQGAGAGNDTTAAGVLADIIDLQDLF